MRTNVETSTGKDTRNAREDTRLVLNKTVQSVSTVAFLSALQYLPEKRKRQ